MTERLKALHRDHPIRVQIGIIALLFLVLESLLLSFSEGVGDVILQVLISLIPTFLAKTSSRFENTSFDVLWRGVFILFISMVLLFKILLPELRV